MSLAGIETSDSDVVVKSDNEDFFVNGDPEETFDNEDYESEASKAQEAQYKEKFKERIAKAKEVSKAKKAAQEDGDEDEEVKPADKKKKDIDRLSDSEDGLDEKEDKEDKKVKKDEEEEDEESDEEKTEEEKAEDEKKAEIKKLKIRMSDGLYGIESDAKVRVKVDGEFQEVPVQDLINNYSGKVAYDKKFTELGQQRKELENINTEVTKTKDFLKETLDTILKKIDDPEADPYDALTFLVEKSGKDPYTVWRRNLEANLETIEKVLEMDPAERKAFFLEKKDEFRTKSDAARMEAYQKEQAFSQAIQKVDSLRQAHGVSEEQYLNALDELEADGQDLSKLSDEQIVDYASLKPHLDKVQDVLEPYQDFIDDAKYAKIVTDFAKSIRSQEMSAEQLEALAKKTFVDEDLKDLTARTNLSKKTTKKEAIKAPEKVETLDFDDWD